MLLILGLITPKLVALNNQSQPAIFMPKDYQNFRDPKNIDEYRSCVFEALRFYEFCLENRQEELAGPFELNNVTEDLIKQIIELPDIARALPDLNKAHNFKHRLRTCKICGLPFLAICRQNTCNSRSCRAKSRSGIFKAYYRRKLKQSRKSTKLSRVKPLQSPDLVTNCH